MICMFFRLCLTGIGFRRGAFFPFQIKKKRGVKLLPKSFGMVYFGPSYSDNEIKEDLARNKIVYKKWLNR